MSDGRGVELYLVTDTALCGGPDGVVETAEAAARGGVDMIQIRDHDASTRELCSLTTRVIDAVAALGARRAVAQTPTPRAAGGRSAGLYDEECPAPRVERDSPTGAGQQMAAAATPISSSTTARRVRVVVDDRLDVALAVGADGVHLGQSDLDPVVARRLADRVVGEGFHLGWSVSNLEQVAAATRLPRGTVDLLGIGPFRATPTKPDAAQPLGLDGVGAITDAARAGGFANVVIGGVKLTDLRALVAAGAQGVAVVSAICGQPDPLAATQALRSELDEALAEVRPVHGGRGALELERPDHAGPA